MRFKAISDYFFSDDSILITIDEDKIFESYKVFQYDYNKLNDSTFSYSIYEFLNDRRKEYIIRIVEWDRSKAKKKITKSPTDIEMELNSEIYYINNVISPKVKLLLKEIRDFFMIESSFHKADTLNLQSKIYIDFEGFSKTIQWGAPLVSNEIESFLTGNINKIKDIINDINDESILRADVLYNLCPYEYEKMLLNN